MPESWNASISGGVGVGQSQPNPPRLQGGQIHTVALFADDKLAFCRESS